MGTPEQQYVDSLEAEAQSWANPDTSVPEKLLRERIRHYKIIRDLLLDKLPTHGWHIAEVGGGPLPVSDLLPYRSRSVIDPCADTYRGIAPCPDHITAEVEDLAWGPDFDLVIATNSLDHVQNVNLALRRMDGMLRRGGFMAILCAENNALIHKHPSHQINLTVRDIHRQYDHKYETVWQLDWEHDRYRYGWLRHEGRCGQPAFAWLGRKALD